MIRARTALVWIVALTVMTLAALATFAQTAPKPWWDHRPMPQTLWDYSTMTDDRIVLHYPNIMPEETARAFLENRRAALEFVEGFLQVELEKPLMIQIHVSLIAFSGRAIDPNVPSILFNIPFHRFQNTTTLLRSGVHAHEETHVVAYCAWSAFPSQPVNEGLAVAVDFRSRPRNTYDPHLLSKGLALRDELMAIEPLFSQPFDAPRPASTSRDVLYTYLETASFVLFLIDQYGLERFQRLYRVSLVPIPNFGEAFCRIYDEELAHVERDWRQFLESYSVGQEARAKYVVQAMFDFSDRITDALSELEKYWNRSPFQLVSPSEQVSNEHRTLTSSLVGLGNFSDQGITSSEADEAYEAFEKALAAVESSLVLWLRAIQMFESVLNLILDIPDYEDVITKLEEAQTLYRQVGDDGMVTRTSEYIAAFQHLQEGRIALINGDHELARNSFSMAWVHFSKLDERGIIHHVKRLLELSRHVVS